MVRELNLAIPFHFQLVIWGPFFKRPRNLLGSKANIKISTCWIVAQFQAHKPVNFASLTDRFIVLKLSKSLNLGSWVQTEQAHNIFPGPKSFWDFQETNPRELKSKFVAPCSFLNGLFQEYSIIYCTVQTGKTTLPTFADVSINGMLTSEELQYSNTSSLLTSRSPSKSCNK